MQDILDAIGQIEIEQVKGKAAFDSSPLVQVWMVHHLMIIGEAVRAIDPAVRQRYPSIPWRQIAGMRNILVHDYFRINQEIVWETVDKHVPALKEEIARILNQLPAD
jgi:uncharacterized protein with HEPN domain